MRSLDSIAYSKAHSGNRRTFEILMEAQGYWTNMDRFRKERERNKKYTFGDQWSDVICVNGKQMREEEYIKEQGNIPLVNNHIHRLVKQFLGVYRSQSKEPTCVARDREEQKLGETMSTVLQYNMRLNQMQEPERADYGGIPYQRIGSTQEMVWLEKRLPRLLD